LKEGIECSSSLFCSCVLFSHCTCIVSFFLAYQNGIWMGCAGGQVPYIDFHYSRMSVGGSLPSSKEEGERGPGRWDARKLKSVS
jgi:hypothetical protein